MMEKKNEKSTKTPTKKTTGLLTLRNSHGKVGLCTPRCLNKKHCEYRSRCDETLSTVIHPFQHVRACVHCVCARERTNKMSPSADISTIISATMSEGAEKDGRVMDKGGREGIGLRAGNAGLKGGLARSGGGHKRGGQK